MNRTGDVSGNAVLYFVFFGLVGIMFLGFWIGYGIFYGDEYDFRQKEANTLLDLVSACVVEKELFDNAIEKEAFFETCGISLAAIEDGEHLIYINSTAGEFSAGVTSFRTECFLSARKKNLDYPLCAEFRQGQNYILVGSSQTSRRVSL